MNRYFPSHPFSNVAMPVLLFFFSFTDLVFFFNYWLAHHFSPSFIFPAISLMIKKNLKAPHPTHHLGGNKGAFPFYRIPTMNIFQARCASRILMASSDHPLHKRPNLITVPSDQSIIITSHEPPCLSRRLFLF